jgi:hypothetical protein
MGGLSLPTLPVLPSLSSQATSAASPASGGAASTLSNAVDAIGSANEATAQGQAQAGTTAASNVADFFGIPVIQLVTLGSGLALIIIGLIVLTRVHETVISAGKTAAKTAVSAAIAA